MEYRTIKSGTECRTAKLNSFESGSFTELKRET